MQPKRSTQNEPVEGAAPDPALSQGASQGASQESPQGWEIAHQWRVAWRSVKWFVSGLIFLGALIVAGQVFVFHQMFSEIHPLLGWLFVAIFGGLGLWFIGLPTVRFFQSPAIARPPDVDLRSADISPSALAHRIAFDDAYLKRMAANPALGEDRAGAAQARNDLKEISQTVSSANVRRSADALEKFERERIASLLSNLDKRIDAYIRRESISVGAATAVSMNGSIDAFIVLWRNVNMVSRISRLYYGRPNLRLSLMIMRDVSLAVILSRAVEDVTEAAGEALGGVVSKLGGMVVGPLMDGSINALMTLKLGYLAKKRCRSFDVWSEARVQRATVEVFEQVKNESASLVSDLLKACGGIAGAAAGVAEKVFAAPKSAWSIVQDTFTRKSAP